MDNKKALWLTWASPTTPYDHLPTWTIYTQHMQFYYKVFIEDQREEGYEDVDNILSTRKRLETKVANKPKQGKKGHVSSTHP